MNKKLTKEQIEKRKQIKNKLMRILNVICYVCTILLIVIAISTGMQSCKNSKNKNQQNLNYKVLKNQLRAPSYDGNPFDLTIYKYYYDTVYTGVHTLTSTTCEIINNAYDIPNGVYGEQGESIDRSVILPDFDSYFYDSDGNAQHLIEMRVGFGSYLGTVGYRYRLNYVSFADNNGNWYNFIAKQYNLYNDYDYLFASDLEALFSKYLYDNIIFNNYFVLQNIDGYTNFRMQDKLNYYWWVDNSSNKDNLSGGWPDIVYLPSVFGSHDEYFIRIQLPKFMCNGKIYDEIQLHYTSLEYWSDGSLYDYINWYYHPEGNKLPSYSYFIKAGYGFLWEISYCLYDGGNSWINADVAYRRNEQTVINSNNEPIWCFTNDCYWINSGYKNINFIEQVDETDSNYQNLINLNGLNSSMNYSGSLIDVFDLFGTAFTSLTSLLGIAIIPGFTIGMLLCLPLVVTLIIIIVRLIKK